MARYQRFSTMHWPRSRLALLAQLGVVARRAKIQRHSREDLVIVKSASDSSNVPTQVGPPPVPPPVMEAALDWPLRAVLVPMQARIMERTTYFGIPALKNPLDFWVYQELIYQQQPDVIIEIGTRYGGSTLALAHLLDLLGKGRLIGVDLSQALADERVRQHPRINLLEGDACQVFPQVAALVNGAERVLIIEDSAHTYENTLAVLRAYSTLLKPGDYFIVEDGICHHGLALGPQPGPYEAIETFIAESPAFVIERGKEDFLITWNPKGFLRRVS